MSDDDALDAARYRYIRDNAYLHEPYSASMNRRSLDWRFAIDTGFTNYSGDPKPPSLDECIDKAMKGE